MLGTHDDIWVLDDFFLTLMDLVIGRMVGYL